MRNFSSVVSRSNHFMVPANEPLDGEVILAFQRALIIAMDANPVFMTPSQEGVIADFTRWIEKGQSEAARSLPVLEPVFFYANLNLGHSVAFVLVE